MKKNQTYKVKNRLWICTDEGTYLGEGRIALLKEIDRHGSISKAAKAMKMSYKKAWELVNSMNKQGNELLVARKIGGVNGGGSGLSDAGREAIKLFTELNKSGKDYLDQKLKEIDFS